MAAPKKTDPPPFSGFDSPKQNWFKMPNEWIELCADISSVAEIKVVQYVMRHTWGHQEYGIRKRISLDEFMNGRRRKDGSRMDKGTGLSKPSVISGVRNAVQRGFLIEEIDDSDKARVKKYYSLRMMPDAGEKDGAEDTQSPPDDEGGVKDLDADVKNFDPGVKSLDPSGKETLHRTEKDTLERHLEKDTTSNNNDSPSEQPVDQDRDDVVVALTDHGISKKVAQKLARTYDDAMIREKLDYLAFMQKQQPDKIKRPASWLRKAIEDDYAAPDGYGDTEEDAAARRRRDYIPDEYADIIIG